MSHHPSHSPLAGYPDAPGWLTTPATWTARPLSGPEIVQLEAAGCSAQDWSRVRAADPFDPSRVQRTHFVGDVVLGRFQGTVEREGIPLPSGVFDSTVAFARISDDARVSRIGILSNATVGPNALVADCDEIVGVVDGTYGNGISVGLHAANADRSIPVVADLPFNTLTALVRPRPDQAILHEVENRAAAYAAACRSGETVVGAGAHVSGCRRVSGSWISAGCVIRGATTVMDSTLLSDDGQDAARVGAGTIVRSSLLQWNAVVEDGAFVEGSLLAEASTVTRHGIVTGSAIGPNTTVAEGEVSASVVGPFTGFNHQALLVSACWPEGRGNIGYGANVGSNHTGRAPDQEIHPGEGTFFGLGVNIKMPADFSEAPYTIIATGVDTLPQRLSMPFSLIVAGSAPDALNRLFPGWGLSRNLYGILRNVWKYSTRDRERGSQLDPDAFRPATMALVERAHDILVAASADHEGAAGGSKAQFSPRDLPGIGKNVVHAADLVDGIRAYAATLRWYGLRAYFRHWESSGQPPSPADVPYLARFVTADHPGTLLDLYLRAEKDRLASVLTSKARDDHRGARTIEDYVQVHTAAADDPLYLWCRDRFNNIEARIEVLRATV